MNILRISQVFESVNRPKVYSIDRVYSQTFGIKFAYKDILLFIKNFRNTFKPKIMRFLAKQAPIRWVIFFKNILASVARFVIFQSCFYIQKLSFGQNLAFYVTILNRNFLSDLSTDVNFPVLKINKKEYHSK